MTRVPHLRWDSTVPIEMELSGHNLKGIENRRGKYGEKIFVAPWNEIEIVRYNEIPRPPLPYSTWDPPPSTVNFRKIENYDFNGQLKDVYESDGFDVYRFLKPTRENIEGPMARHTITTITSTFDRKYPAKVLKAAVESSATSQYQSQCNSRHARLFRKECPFSPTFIDEVVETFSPLPEPIEHPVIAAIKHRAVIIPGK